MQPFGVHKRAAVQLLQEVDDLDHVRIGRIAMEGDDVGQIGRQAFARVAALQNLRPHACRQRLVRIDVPSDFEELPHDRHGNFAAARRARLVDQIPHDDARILRVFRHQLRRHFIELSGQLRIVQDSVAMAPRMRHVRRLLHAAVIAPIDLLRAERFRLVDFFWNGAVVADRDHHVDTVLRARLDVAFKTLHEAVVLLLPHFELHDETDGIEADGGRQFQFAIRRLQTFLEAQLLPLIDAIRAVAPHEIAATQPRLRIIPFPCFFLRPSRFVHYLFLLF